ncbi:MAG: hypothetical protein H6Q90_251 [Deltaproteobacteria bacterium]|nr:hypothetical protein [Deltaproteobacteria bacterium]
MRHGLVIVVGLAACNPFRAGEVNGRVESTGDTGAWVMEKGTCYSGQREQYFGALALGPEGTGIGIKLVKDSVRGWTAVVNIAGECKQVAEHGNCRAIAFSPAECTTLDVDLANNNTTINDIREIEGKLQIDCKTETASVKGQLIFDRCH